jgi:ectoine hydroxylase-related dioxygenase (phytanoyl-CoA dioxygenase family)
VQTTSATPTPLEVADALSDIETMGITARKAAFDVAWVDQMHEDVMAAFAEARSREAGAISRGPNRWYVEVHPEQLRGFVQLATHPWVRAVCQAVLGPDYRIVEIGFDVPFAGAVDQPWHRDFRSPEETWRERRLTSLAFNLTTVDTTADMGPFQIAPGTHFEGGQEWEHGMFPPRSEWARFEAGSQLRMPQRGDVSARSALALHRGTANHSEQARPVVILGVDGPEEHDARHDMTVTRDFWETLQPDLRHHLHARVVDELTPLAQRHTIEGLAMGVE